MSDSTFKKSDAWIENRLKSIGGSEIASLTGKSPYKSAYQVWQEKTRRVQPPDLSNLPFIIRGHLSEEIARDKIERERLRSYRPKSWKHPVYEYFTASDDGYNIDHHELLECKAMGKDAHKAAKESQTIPPWYMEQMQWALMVSGATRCTFISYRVEDDDMVCIDVFPDKKMQEELVAVAQNFWLNHVLKDIPPPMTDLDYITIDKPELDQLLEEYRKAQDALTELSTKVDEIKAKIKPYTATHAMVCNKAGYKIKMGKRDGGYDYKKFVAETGVSEETLKPYKKKDVAVFTIQSPALIFPSSLS